LVFAAFELLALIVEQSCKRHATDRVRFAP
jgi:hypothetical protein